MTDTKLFFRVSVLIDVFTSTVHSTVYNTILFIRIYFLGISTAKNCRNLRMCKELCRAQASSRFQSFVYSSGYNNSCRIVIVLFIVLFRSFSAL